MSGRPYSRGGGTFVPRGGGRGGFRGGRGGGFMTGGSHPPPQSSTAAKEKSSRTLFVRNVAYESNTADVRAVFEKFGEIRRFFDLIQKRGLVFVSYVS